MASASSGKSAGRISRAGRFITSKARPPSRTASMRRRPAAGSVRSSSAPTMVGKTVGSPSADRSSTIRRRSGHAQVVRRHAASVGVQAHLASRTFADRSGYRLCRGGRRGDVQDGGRRQNMAGASRVAQRQGSSLAARRGRHGVAHDPSRSRNANRIFIAISAAGAFRTDDGGKTWKPVNRGLKSQYELPIRTRKSDTASIASPCTRRARTSCSCRNTGT